MCGKTTLPALGHIGPEVRSFYSDDDNTGLLAGAEQEGPAHNPWSTHPPHPVAPLPRSSTVKQDIARRDFSRGSGTGRVIGEQLRAVQNRGRGVTQHAEPRGGGERRRWRLEAEHIQSRIMRSRFPSRCSQVEVHLQNLPARCALCAAPGPRPATGSPSDMLAGSLTSRPAWPTALSIGLSDTALITILERSINHDARDTTFARSIADLHGSQLTDTHS